MQKKMAGVWWLEKGRKGWGRCCILDPVRRRTEDTVEQHQICTDFIGVCCSMSVCVCVGMWRACGRAVLSSGQGVCVCVEGRQSWSIPPPPHSFLWPSVVSWPSASHFNLNANFINIPLKRLILVSKPMCYGCVAWTCHSQ